MLPDALVTYVPDCTDTPTSDQMVEKPRVMYRGLSMIEGWPERMREAQLEGTCWPNGVEMARVPYGKESSDWGASERPCHDCRVMEGEFHVPGCDVEECPSCHQQLLSVCECEWR